MRRLPMNEFPSWEGQGVGKDAYLTDKFQKVAHRVQCASPLVRTDDVCQQFGGRFR